MNWTTVSLTSDVRKLCNDSENQFPMGWEQFHVTLSLLKVLDTSLTVNMISSVITGLLLDGKQQQLKVRTLY